MTAYVFTVSYWAMQHFFVVLFAVKRTKVIILEEYPCLFSASTFGQNIFLVGSFLSLIGRRFSYSSFMSISREGWR